MTIQAGLFALGLLLLLIPADRLLSAQVELRSFDCFRRLGAGGDSRPWWWVPALWLDPLRAFAGASLLQRSLGVNSPYFSLVAKPSYALLLVILTIAVLAQTFTRRADRGVLLAPIGFSSGIAVALTSWPLALFSVLAGFLGLFAFRQFYAYFGFGLVAITLLGFAFDAPTMWTIPVAGAFALPVALGIVTNRTLEFPVRDVSGRQERAVSDDARG